MLVNLNIRPASKSDLLSISDIELRSSLYEGRKEPLSFSITQMYEVWRQRLVSSRFTILVADINDNVIGFIALVIDQKEHAFVQAVYVDPDFMFQGVGKALMIKAEKIAKIKKAPGMMLFLEPGNTIGFNFYSGLGFIKKAQKYRHLHIMVKEF